MTVAERAFRQLVWYLIRKERFSKTSLKNIIDEVDTTQNFKGGNA